jgi:hypothetical protein
MPTFLLPPPPLPASPSPPAASRGLKHSNMTLVDAEIVPTMPCAGENAEEWQRGHQTMDYNCQLMTTDHRIDIRVLHDNSYARKEH